MALQRDSDSEDLGIIDLDKDGIEGSDDVFAELDDDKLPILKNTYIKKNRPNNSKSVAIGSRSQGGAIKIRTVPNPDSFENYNEQNVIEEQQKKQQRDYHELTALVGSSSSDINDFVVTSDRKEDMNYQIKRAYQIRGGI